jgi:predicted nucleotidyltransferase
MVTAKQIRDFSRRLADEFHPERIVLFGSYAHGQPHADSDVDLLVVSRKRQPSVEQSVAMRLKLRPAFPLDLLVRSPAKIKRRLALGDQFIRDIMERGKVLYEAAGR